MVKLLSSNICSKLIKSPSLALGICSEFFKFYLRCLKSFLNWRAEQKCMIRTNTGTDLLKVKEQLQTLVILALVTLFPCQIKFAHLIRQKLPSWPRKIMNWTWQLTELRSQVVSIAVIMVQIWDLNVLQMNSRFLQMILRDVWIFWAEMISDHAPFGQEHAVCWSVKATATFPFQAELKFEQSLECLIYLWNIYEIAWKEIQGWRRASAAGMSLLVIA